MSPETKKETSSAEGEQRSFHAVLAEELEQSYNLGSLVSAAQQLVDDGRVGAEELSDFSHPELPSIVPDAVMSQFPQGVRKDDLVLSVIDGTAMLSPRHEALERVRDVWIKDMLNSMTIGGARKQERMSGVVSRLQEYFDEGLLPEDHWFFSYMTHLGENPSSEGSSRDHKAHHYASFYLEDGKVQFLLEGRAEGPETVDEENPGIFVRRE